MIRKNPYRKLEKALGYTFKKKMLLERALTHRSFRFENAEVSSDNQRMEFLGDAVLGFAVAAALIDQYPDSDEGVLTSFRSQTTSGKALSDIARGIDLGGFLKVGKGEERSGGRERLSNLEDALEAVLGAVYLDSGIRGVNKVLLKIFVPYMRNLSGDVWADNPKGKLQEYSQRKWKSAPRYRLLKKEGPAHESIFTVEVELSNKVKGIGKGRNKQKAEAKAATEALRQLQCK